MLNVTVPGLTVHRSLDMTVVGRDGCRRECNRFGLVTRAERSHSHRLRVERQAQKQEQIAAKLAKNLHNKRQSVAEINCGTQSSQRYRR